MSENKTYCSNCFYGSYTDQKLFFDSRGYCTGCQNSEFANTINWNERLEKLKIIFNELKKSSKNQDYDLVIGVSGGKDSYYQTHFAKNILGLRPLLVTYYGNNYTDDGEYNLRRMKEIFDVDHIIFKPETDVLIKMNRLGFRLQGDMNWHNHCGIMTYPIRVAIEKKINVILWGEHGYMDRSGMFSYDDYVEFTKKYRKEHDLRGFDWYDFTNQGLEKHNLKNFSEGLTESDLSWAIYPSDKEIFEVGLRGIYLSNFQSWDGNKNAAISKKLYGWREYQGEFQRTYRKISNLDDMHENGAHDYLKFIKYGYGRGSDHSTKDLRLGYITREQGIAYVKKYDHIIPTQDLKRWYNYAHISEEEFHSYSEKFRDPRVWYIKNNKWYKKNFLNEEKSFGAVLLNKKFHYKYLR
jgi:N-acetyl sugar amidotransferase